MSYLTGEYECKLDAKGRMMIPVALKKQLPEAETEGLVINRGLENYLVIYTKKEWDKKLDELSKLSEYDRKAVSFVRAFMAGATTVIPDGAGRINFPKNLLEYAGISNDVVLTSMLNKVEVWDEKAHKAMRANEPENFAELAEEVMGTKKRVNE